MWSSSSRDSVVATNSFFSLYRGSSSIGGCVHFFFLLFLLFLLCFWLVALVLLFLSFLVTIITSTVRMFVLVGPILPGFIKRDASKRMQLRCGVELPSQGH